MRSMSGKARAGKLDKPELSAIKRVGGKAAAAMNAKQRSKAARRAVNIRWDRVRAARTLPKVRQAERRGWLLL
jgi:hypothetical protein